MIVIKNRHNKEDVDAIYFVFSEFFKNAFSKLLWHHLVLKDDHIVFVNMAQE